MIDPHDNLPANFDKVEARLDNVILLDEAGVDYAITNAGALGVSNAVTLTQHAGNAVGNGLDWNKAFAAITSTPGKWIAITRHQRIHVRINIDSFETLFLNT